MYFEYPDDLELDARMGDIPDGPFENETVSRENSGLPPGLWDPEVSPETPDQEVLSDRQGLRDLLAPRGLLEQPVPPGQWDPEAIPAQPGQPAPKGIREQPEPLALKAPKVTREPLDQWDPEGIPGPPAQPEKLPLLPSEPLPRELPEQMPPLPTPVRIRMLFLTLPFRPGIREL